MKHSLLTLFTLTLTMLSAQQSSDYEKMRVDLVPQICGFRDSLSSAEIYTDLLKLDTNSFINGIEMYYHDLSETEYFLFMYTGDAGLLSKSIKSAIREMYHDPKSATSWNIAFRFHLFGECERMETYLAHYKKHYPRNYRKSKEKIELMRSECKNAHDRIFGKS